MNRLAFGEFHQKHFSSEQKIYWSSILQQQQNTHYPDPNQYQQSYYDPNQYYTHYQHPYDNSYEESLEYQQDTNQQHTEACYDESYIENQQYDEGEEYQNEDEDADLHGLSKEAIEIFRFSEAYRKEKELKRQEEEDQDQECMENWQYDESNVHCSGGLEAPSTSLVILKPESERPHKNTKLRIQEELLNSSFLSACRQDSTPIILWPVLPFKM